MKKHNAALNMIAYKGPEFTIEWYFDEKGYSNSKEYYSELDLQQQKKVAHLFRLMGDQGEILNIEKFRHEGDQIYAFKSVPDRFLCFFYQEGKIIVTNAFEKKCQKLPPNEKERALKYRDDYKKKS